MAKIELSAEQRKDLEDRGQEMADARVVLEKLHDLGVDVRKMEGQLLETERLREGLLRDF